MTSDSAVTTTVRGTDLLVTSPYHPDLPAQAKALGGRWSAADRAWRYDARDAEPVRELYRRIYGTDGAAPSAAEDLVTLRITATESISASQGGTYVAGRCLAVATGRDSGARLGGGVTLVSGPAPRSGGSVKNWETRIPAGSVLQVRDVPRAAAAAAIHLAQWATIEILDNGTAPVTLDRAALEAERARIVTRLAEIDALLVTPTEA